MVSLLVAGGTGVVGAAVAELASERGHSVRTLSRSEASARDGVRHHVGDARVADLGLDPGEADEVREEVDAIVVAVGTFDLSVSLSGATAEHLAPLRGVLAFAQSCPRLRTVVLVSSLLAVGDVRQRVDSGFVPVGSKHRNFYEWAKLAGEKVARSSSIPVDIVRAGHILAGRMDASPPDPQAIMSLLPMLAAGWPLPVVGSNRYWAAPPGFVAEIVVDRAERGTGGSSVWAVDPRSPSYAQIFDLANARYGLRSRRVRSASLARAVAAVVRPSWVDLGIPREVFDYCNAVWDLDLACLDALIDDGRVTPPPDRQYVVDALDAEYRRLQECLP